MNWQHLVYFDKVAKYEHLTKAAEELFMTSSALSRAMSSLEEELGISLFERSSRKIKLTQYGKVFHNYVHQAITSVNTGTSVVQRLADIKNGTINVSSIFSVGASYIPSLVRQFHEKHEGIQIELAQKTTQQILHDITDGVTDIGFCGEFDNDEEYPLINKEFIYYEEVVLIVPNSHALATKKEVSFEDIKDETFIGYNNSTGIVHTIYNEIASKGYPDFRFKTAFKSNEDSNVVGLVREGLGIAFLVNIPTLHMGGVTMLKLSDLFFMRAIYMVWKKNAYLTPPANLFRKFALSRVT